MKSLEDGPSAKVDGRTLAELKAATSVKMDSSTSAKPNVATSCKLDQVSTAKTSEMSLTLSPDESACATTMSLGRLSEGSG